MNNTVRSLKTSCGDGLSTWSFISSIYSVDDVRGDLKGKLHWITSFLKKTTVVSYTKPDHRDIIDENLLSKERPMSRSWLLKAINMHSGKIKKLAGFAY